MRWLPALSMMLVSTISYIDRNTLALLAPSLRTNVLVMPQFKETPEEIQSEINLSKGMSLNSKAKADIPITQILSYLRLHP